MRDKCPKIWYDMRDRSIKEMSFMFQLEKNYDVIIAGAGAAGLYAALHLPSELRVLVLGLELHYHRAVAYQRTLVAVEAGILPREG